MGFCKFTPIINAKSNDGCELISDQYISYHSKESLGHSKEVLGHAKENLKTILMHNFTKSWSFWMPGAARGIPRRDF